MIKGSHNYLPGITSANKERMSNRSSLTSTSPAGRTGDSGTSARYCSSESASNVAGDKA